jgi:hypothetical protein
MRNILSAGELRRLDFQHVFIENPALPGNHPGDNFNKRSGFSSCRATLFVAVPEADA